MRQYDYLPSPAKRMFRQIYRLLPIIGLSVLTGCSQEPPEMTPTEVVTSNAELREYFPKRTYVGRLNAREDVQIQARVTGYLTSLNFKEGEQVTQGDPLYSIDKREFEAALLSAKAELKAAQANQEVAELNFKRGEELLPKQAISKSDFDNLKAKKLEAEAGLAAAQAGIKTAEVNLSFTEITAPISGRIGRSVATVGDLIGPNSGTLTTLVSMDPIEAIFSISESAYVASSEERVDTDDQGEIEISDIKVSLELTDNQKYPLSGHIDYFANRIDDNTGTLEARALIPNPRGILVPGQYTRVVLELSTALTGLFIPQAAIQADQEGFFVMAIDAGNTVLRKTVELGDRSGADVQILRGVEAGDEIIVRGLQLVRPGQIVTTRPVNPGS